MNPDDLLFCASLTAGPLEPWCLRLVGPEGAMFYGGIDTESLCGKVMPAGVGPWGGGWDSRWPVTKDSLSLPLLYRYEYVCEECLKIYEATV